MRNLKRKKKLTESYRCLNASIQDTYVAIFGGLPAAILLPLMLQTVETTDSGYVTELASSLLKKEEVSFSFSSVVF